MDRRSFVQVLGAGTLGPVARLDGYPHALRDVRRHSPSQAVTTRRVVTLDAAPSPFVMNTATTAVVVVDMQNDFGSEGGMFHRAGIDISMIRAAVAPTARALSAARSAGIKIIYLKMAFREDMADAGPLDSPSHARHLLLGAGKVVQAPNGQRSRVLVRDTWNTDIVPELAPHPDDVVIYKHRFSGFFETELEAILTRANVTSLVVVGCTTSICVESTIRDAMFRDYACVLLQDCSGEPIGHGLSRSNHEASLLSIQTLLGWVSASKAFIKALDGA